MPTRPRPTQEQLDALRLAGEKLDALIAAAGTNEDELMADLDRLHSEKRRLKA